MQAAREYISGELKRKWCNFKLKERKRIVATHLYLSFDCREIWPSRSDSGSPSYSLKMPQLLDICQSRGCNHCNLLHWQIILSIHFPKKRKARKKSQKLPDADSERFDRNLFFEVRQVMSFAYRRLPNRAGART